jgi:hypothetical protein
MTEETCSGIQCLNTLILLLQAAYHKGVVTNCESSLPLILALIVGHVILGVGFGSASLTTPVHQWNNQKREPEPEDLDSHREKCLGPKSAQITQQK